MFKRQSTRIWLVLGLAGLIASACSSPAPVHKATGSTAVTTTTAQQITASTVTIGGTSYPVPTEAPGIPIKSFSDSGQQIIYTSTGFLPRTLFSATATPVMVTNLSAKTVTITAPSVGLSPKVLAPGASFSYTPTALAYTYNSSSGDHCVVNVGAFS